MRTPSLERQVSTKAQGVRHGQCAARAAHFRKWLLEVYGSEFLSQGSGVLDVGCGRGDLAFQLLNLNGVPVVGIDPRPLEVDMYAQKFRTGHYLRGQTGPMRSDCYDVLGCQLQVPQHMRMFMRSTMSVSVCPALDTNENTSFEQNYADIDPQPALDRDARARVVEEEIEQAMVSAQQVSWSEKGLQAADHESASTTASSRGDVFSERDYTAACIAEKGSGRRTLWACSLVVGLYPDQAIDALVDFALCSGKPFAAVPCCVYADQFPDRRLPDGRHVACYDDLVAFLVAKDPSRIKLAHLPFKGPKNVVVYIAPPLVAS